MADKKVLVVGGGGREHAIVDALYHSLQTGKIYCAPGNAGIASKSECVPIKDDDIYALRDFALEKNIDLTVVGPEVPLSAGIVDVFKTAGLLIFGPSEAAAKIESSKDFAKRLMLKYGVPTASYRTFEDYSSAVSYAGESGFPLVLKYDGLAAGKGVVIAESYEQADEALKEMLLDDRFGKGKVVIEEFLTGPEFSFMCFVRGREVYPMVLAQDHKRAFEGDKGPNTGGMGAYSPVPFITCEDEAFALENIMKPVAAAMVEEGCPFCGVLYGGLIKTPEGIKVIEFNCRFGDPETEVVLPRLKTDIYEVFASIASYNAENPQEAFEFPALEWDSSSIIGFVMASKGYPGGYKKGSLIYGLDAASAVSGVSVYHMGTAFACGGEEGGILTAGGRVMMIIAKGENLKTARDRALEAAGNIKCDNLFFRRDIGWRVL